MNITKTARLTTFTLLGAPGSGKGTYGSMLAAALRCPLRGTSDILREWLESSDQPLAPSSHEQTRNEMNTGRLVDDALVSEIMQKDLANFLERPRAHSVILLDGYPRTRQQLQQMISFWPESHLAIHVDVPDDICASKIMGRRQCSLCKGSFNITDIDRWHGFTMPPSLPSTTTAPCWNRCGGQYQPWLVTRPDDSDESVIASRLHLYHEQTMPVIQWYRDQNRLLTFRPLYGKRDFPHLKDMVTNYLNIQRLISE